MAKLAFLGPGLMGTPMATRLLEAGHDLTVWNRTSARTTLLVDQGASAAQAVAGADAVITMLATPQALQQVRFAPDGEAGALAPRQWLIDMCTVDPETVRSVAGRLPTDVTLIDARSGAAFPRRRPAGSSSTWAPMTRTSPGSSSLLAPLGTPHHVGGPAAGAATELVVNLTLAVTMTALGEALELGDSLGPDRRTVLDILAESPIGTTVRTTRAHIESGTYPPCFELRPALEDLRLVTRTPTPTGRALVLAAASRSWLEQAERAGADDLDHSVVVPTILGALSGPGSTDGWSPEF
jgi:3-hydroxyisobutyrate dehydrogenase-like beta-hydroxyacid dehydrogenase